MENSVEDKDLHFLIEGAAEAASIAPGDGWRDGDIAEIRFGSRGSKCFRPIRFCEGRSIKLGSIDWKGQYIGGAFFATVGAIPVGHLGVVNQADDERAGRKAEAAKGALEKFVEFSNGNTNATLAIEDHGNETNRGDSCRRNCPRGPGWAGGSRRRAYRWCARRRP